MMSGWYYLAFAAAVALWVAGLVVFLNRRWQQWRRAGRVADRARFARRDWMARS